MPRKLQIRKAPIAGGCERRCAWTSGSATEAANDVANLLTWERGCRERLSPASALSPASSLDEFGPSIPRCTCLSHRSLTEVLDEAQYHKYPSWVPTYISIAAAPSRYPPRRFCSISGLSGKYKCPVTGEYLGSLDAFTTHRETRLKGLI